VGDIGVVGHATPPVPDSAGQPAESTKRREAPRSEAEPAKPGQPRPRAGRSGRKPLRSTAAG
jgi:hypothetical protein